MKRRAPCGQRRVEAVVERVLGSESRLLFFMVGFASARVRARLCSSAGSAARLATEPAPGYRDTSFT